MKFTEGQWLNKKNYKVNFAQQVYKHTFENNLLTIFAPFNYVNSRSQTIDQGMLTIKYSSPIKDVFEVNITHFEGATNKIATFPLTIQKNENVEYLEDDLTITLQSGDSKVLIDKVNYNAIFYFKNEKVTSSPNRSTAYILDDNENPFIREQLALGVGETIYGLGEKFTPFVKNGQVIEIWNEDGGTSSELSYKNIPFYISNKNYGVFVNNTGKVSFEVGSEHVERMQFSIPGETLDYFVICGDGMKNILKNYTDISGKPSIPPAWSFGLWLTTSFTTSYDEKTVMSFIDGMEQREIPLHVFHFDCFWMKEFQLCDFEWDLDVFPNPKEMLKRIKAKGLKICVWINPYIAQKTKMFKEGMENGYFLKRANGDVWQWDKWQAGMAIVDFTNPDACEWYSSKLKALIDVGVDCFKTDFGERIPTDVVYYDNSNPINMHNFYTYLYNKCVYDLLIKELGKNEAVLFARSATACCQKFPVHWGGDCFASYVAMAESLRGGLSLCMSGFGFWSHDIGGFESTATPDIYKRWVAFGLLSSHSRLHGSKTYRVPWLFDEESVSVLKYFTNLKCSLMPYLFNQAFQTSKYGYPMMRAMIMEFANDKACKYLDQQYMLGDKLLVAPILNENSEVEYYLPHGTWTSFITNEVVVGGRFIKEKHSYLSLPLMVAENSIIAIGENINEVDYDYSNNVEFHVFNILEGSKVEEKVISNKCEEQMKIIIEKNENIILANVSNTQVNTERKYYIVFRNVFEIDKIVLDGKEVLDFEFTKIGLKIGFDKDVFGLKITL